MIDKFEKRYRFLSNFYPCEVEMYGLKFKSSEAAYQASKVKNPEDMKRFVSLSPMRAKNLGRRVELRDDWDEVKDQIMYDIVNQKFRSNKELAIKLLGTGDEELVEGNDWGDTYWGVCNGIGENHLGKILMSIRDELI